jgi:hypothetical protein
MTSSFAAAEMSDGQVVAQFEKFKLIAEAVDNKVASGGRSAISSEDQPHSGAVPDKTWSDKILNENESRRFFEFIHHSPQPSQRNSRGNLRVESEHQEKDPEEAHTTVEDERVFIREEADFSEEEVRSGEVV